MLKDAQMDKFILFANGCVPLGFLAWDRYWNQLGPNPPYTILHVTGMMSLIFLLLTLCVTPLRKILGSNYLSNFRRELGLFAFFYASVHFLTYFALDRQFDLTSMLRDFLARPFILVGLVGLLVMIPLAITSTNAMIRRLGAKQWKQLHRMSYVAAIAGCVHYYLLVKADERLPLMFCAILALLLGYRIVAATKPKSPKRPPLTA